MFASNLVVTLKQLSPHAPNRLNKVNNYSSSTFHQVCTLNSDMFTFRYLVTCSMSSLVTTDLMTPLSIIYQSFCGYFRDDKRVLTADQTLKFLAKITLINRL